MEGTDKLRNYIDRNINEETRKTTHQWLQSLSDNELENLLAVGWGETPAPMPAEAATMLDTQLKNIGIPVTAPRPFRVLRLVRRMVAAACIILLTGLFFLQKRKSTVPVPAPPTQLANTSMHARKVTLPDGSLVWLSPGAALTVPANYNTGRRDITISGEGYFEVAPHTTPFRVFAGGLEAHVLGTHFNVEAYPGEKATTIALTAGSVAIRIRRDSSLVLKPGFKLISRPATQQVTVRPFVKEREIDWKKGAFVLDDVPLDAVFSRLEYRYHKKVVVNANLSGKARFTGTFNNTNLPDMLTNMAFVYGFKWQVTNDTLFIH
ncbi:MAG: FecR domain-containing protein [Chitinophaga sp.]|uniref:FecR family protein n=1 Tax=Chitinophaga sp. TaxID=1869181 RepID=UPI0025BD16AF|nr:FecR domain-containing protein [Chitinophaga sp.]MBV8255616.1 FecR domain-containing protein [Chitinophaga sp.]